VCEASSGARGNKPLNAAFGYAEFPGREFCAVQRDGQRSGLGEVIVEKQRMRRLWREKLLYIHIKYSFQTGKIITQKAYQK
jgi:hypothetical protein